MPQKVNSLVRTPASHISVLKFSRQSCSRNYWNKIMKVSAGTKRAQAYSILFWQSGGGGGLVQTALFPLRVCRSWTSFWGRSC
jgi:hypothetical protein